MGLNLRVMIHIPVFDIRSGRIVGVLMYTQNYRMLPKDLYVDALAHVTLAWSCVSLQRPLLGGCFVFFLLEMSPEYLRTDLDLTDIHRSSLNF